LKRSFAILLAAVLAVSAASVAVAAYRVSFNSSASEDTVKLGQAFTYSIVIVEYGSTDKQTQLIPPDFKPFTVEGKTSSTDRRILNETPTTETKLSFAMYSDKPGKFTIEPAKYLLIDRARGTKQEMLSNPVEITVLDKKPGVMDDIRDIKEPKTFLDHIKRVFYIAVAVCFLIALVLAAVIILALRKRKKKARPAPVAAAPARDPREAALESLMLAGRLMADPREFYSAVTDALRVYLRDARGIHAVESTTTELIALARAARMPSGLADELRALCAEADLVKFAKHVPGQEEMTGYLSRATDFVKRA